MSDVIDFKRPLRGTRYSLDDIRETAYNEDPETEWLVQGLIPATSVTMLVAPPGTGKTRLLADLIAALSCSTSTFLGEQTRQTRFLYHYQDPHVNEFKRRICDAMTAQQVPMGVDAGEILTDPRGIFDDKQARRELALYCDGEGIDLLIFDTLAGSTRLDLQTHDDAMKLRDIYHELGEDKRSIIVSHHTVKRASRGMGLDAMYGSVDLRAAVGMVMLMHPNGNRRPITDVSLDLYPRGETASTELKVHFEHRDRYMRAHLSSDKKLKQRRDAARESDLLEQVYQFIKANTDCTKKEARGSKDVEGRAADIIAAFDKLAEAGRITKSSRYGWSVV